MRPAPHTARRGARVAALLAAFLASPAAAHAAPAERALKLDWARCFPLAQAPCPPDGTVDAGGALQLAVKAGPNAQVVMRDARGRYRGVRPWWRTPDRLWVRVPRWAADDTVRVIDGTRTSNARRVAVVRPLGAAEVFGGDGMWIWELEQIEGGDVDALIARARESGVEAVYVKAADGRTVWSQFNPELVRRLKDAGLTVCAWQYAYGTDPEGEAAAAATTIRRGADCFIIDAEIEFEGRYGAARRYMTALRRAAGPRYPIALSTFPWVDYHSSFPYSVFLGPGGAQANLPQVYWKAIGVTPERALEQTFATNLPYGRPIFPAGQLYEDPADDEVSRFRAAARGLGAEGVNWWSWQHANPGDWTAATGDEPAPVRMRPAWASLGAGSSGDLVIRAQELLRGAGLRVPVTAAYDAATRAAVARFQRRTRLPRTGVVDEATWRALNRHRAQPTNWARGEASGSAAAG